MLSDNNNPYLTPNCYCWIRRSMERIWHTLNKAQYLDLTLVSTALYHLPFAEQGLMPKVTFLWEVFLMGLLFIVS